MRIDPATFNPILGYKLDPGEPGLAHSAPASMSILRVLNQEISNYMAFKKKAMEKGGFIISGGIFLDLQRRGGFLAAVAGKTKVWMYIPGDKRAGRIKGSTDIDETNMKAQIKKEIENLRIKMETATDPLEREKLSREIEMLELALNSFKAALMLPQFLIGSLLDTLV